MMPGEEEIKEAVELWKNSEENEKKHRQNASEVLRTQKAKHNYTMVQLSDIAEIKRTTLYYVMWGKDGKQRPESVTEESG